MNPLDESGYDVVSINKMTGDIILLMPNPQTLRQKLDLIAEMNSRRPTHLRFVATAEDVAEIQAHMRSQR